MKKTIFLSMLLAMSLFAANDKKVMSEEELKSIQKAAELEMKKPLDKSELAEIKKSLLSANKELESNLNKNLSIVKDNEKCINSIKNEKDIEKCKNDFYNNLKKK